MIGLTDREKQVLSCVLQGYQDKEIEEKLGISVRTVKAHKGSAYEKLHVRSKYELFANLIQTLTDKPFDTIVEDLCNEAIPH